MTDLRSFPETSFLRVFHSARPLSADECQTIQSVMTQFLRQWAAHEQPVAGQFEILEDRFLVVAADESKTPLSGCSKDSLVQTVRAIGQKLGTELVHAPPICFRGQDGIQVVDRKAFGDLVKEGQVGPDTRVFDLTISTAGAFAGGAFEAAAKDCWHAKVYRDLAVAAS